MFSLDMLHHLSAGMAFLGSGGGGDPSLRQAMARYHCEQFGMPEIISADQLQDDDIIVPLAFFGAPNIGQERIASGKELPALLHHITCYYGKKPKAIMPAEIGGGNGLTPMLIASELGYPILNGDLIGRAFPKLHMAIPHLLGINATPAFVADIFGRVTRFDNLSPEELEKAARKHVITCGSSAAIACYIMTGKQARTSIAKGTLTQAFEIGKALSANRLQSIITQYGGRYCLQGVITHIQHYNQDGFLHGRVTICSENGEDAYLHFQNEFMHAEGSDGKIISTSPDIITLMDSDHHSVITTDQLRFGLCVDVVTLPAPNIWYIEEARSMVAYHPIKEEGDVR